MSKPLLFILMCLLAIGPASAQVVLEDFEGGVADLNWVALDGTYDGPVENPAMNGINDSGWAGSYTKSDMHGFSLFLAELPQPLDMSTNNQFSIMVYAGAATQLLLKLEGPGMAVEATRNIPLANTWYELNFDFSAAADMDSLNKIILFFDPGVTDSGDTYLFDNLVANPAGDCAGTIPDPEILDDFECQRNGTIGAGFDQIEVVDNPDPSGINTSDQVGRYLDPPGPWSALVYDWNNGLNLSVRNQVCIKVWAPVTGNLLIKLEGGASPAVEKSVAVTETMSWQEYCVDFSDQANANHKKLAFFFNAGQEPGMDDVYYIDDVLLLPEPPAQALEDFENGPSLNWMSLNNDNNLHGIFNGAIANPDPNGANTSPMVGSYTRGSSNFSTLVGDLPEGIDLSADPQVNLDVWAPAGGASVTLQLQSPTQGVKSVERTLDETQTWVTLNFDFGDFSQVTDFNQVNILFNPGVAGTNTWYFDNLIQGASTVDPCEGVDADPNILDDFACQRNANYVVGGDQLSVIGNPDVSPQNNSLEVGSYDDPEDMWSALVIENDGPWDLSTYNQFSIQVWSPEIVPLLFKLEGGSDAPVEVFAEVSSTNEWVTYTVDFSGAEGTDHNKLAIFFNAGEQSAGETYFIDNLKWARSPFRDACVVNFEEPAFTLTNWRYFANGDFEGNDFLVVANPAPDAVNGSSMVGVFEEAANGEPFAGMFADPDAPIVMEAGKKKMRMKVWMPVAGVVTFKLERPLDGAPGSGDNHQDYTTPGEWQELEWDFSMTAGGAPIPDGARYERITIIPNFGEVPDEPLIHYFDDIAVGDGSCLIDGVFSPVVVDRMRVFPNPAGEVLQVEQAGAARLFRIHNALGQPVAAIQWTGADAERISLPTDQLPAGYYVLTAYDRNGQLVANATFVKR